MEERQAFVKLTSSEVNVIKFHLHKSKMFLKFQKHVYCIKGDTLCREENPASFHYTMAFSEHLLRAICEIQRGPRSSP